MIGATEDPDRSESLAARGKSPAAFERRCLPANGVELLAQRGRIQAGMLARRALLAWRIAVLGATRGLTTDH